MPQKLTQYELRQAAITRSGVHQDDMSKWERIVQGAIVDPEADKLGELLESVQGLYGCSVHVRELDLYLIWKFAQRVRSMAKIKKAACAASGAFWRSWTTKQRTCSLYWQLFVLAMGRLPLIDRKISLRRLEPVLIYLSA